jgi:outer membrane protein assembly factor BamA
MKAVQPTLISLALNFFRRSFVRQAFARQRPDFLLAAYLVVAAILLSLAAAPALACTGVTFELSGFGQTNEGWVREYLELDSVVTEPSAEKLESIRQKLMTTDIFTSVTIAQKTNANSSCTILLEVTEKITTIPVFRGEYGGGTPLAVLGGYSFNTFGRLFAVGGEIRRYGIMAPGAFLFFKSPRAWNGRGRWGVELWLDRRIRPFYDDAGQRFGNAKSEAWTAKMQWLYPVAEGWQAGFQAQGLRERPTVFELDRNYQGTQKTAPKDLYFDPKGGSGGVIGPMLAHDGLEVDGLNLSGLKFTLTAGRTQAANRQGVSAEGELFAFARLPQDVNLASRIFTAKSNQNSLGTVFYLGGFGSIRGLPDGVHYGNSAVIGNFEARIIAAKFKYAHLQPALFLDTGSAWMDDKAPSQNRETSFGGGVRISVPQVLRLVLRIDYGQSVGHTKSSGFSLGINQFFQPQKLVF